MRPLAAPTAAWSASANPQPLAGVAQAAILTNFALRRERPGLAPPAPRNAQKPQAPRPALPPLPASRPTDSAPPRWGEPQAAGGSRRAVWQAQCARPALGRRSWRGRPGSQKAREAKKKRGKQRRKTRRERRERKERGETQGASGRAIEPMGEKIGSGAQQKRRSEDRLFQAGRPCAPDYLRKPKLLISSR